MLGRRRMLRGALAGTFVTLNSNPGRCRSAKIVVDRATY